MAVNVLIYFISLFCYLFWFNISHFRKYYNVHYVTLGKNSLPIKVPNLCLNFISKSR